MPKVISKGKVQNFPYTKKGIDMAKRAAMVKGAILKMAKNKMMPGMPMMD